METIGTYLKKQREMRGIPLEAIASATKINLRCLQALESDDLEKLPGEVFAKGFVRAYAKVTGLNADEAALQYEEYARSLQGLPNQKEESKKPPFEATRGLVRARRPWAIALGLVLFVLFVAFLSTR